MAASQKPVMLFEPLHEYRPVTLGSAGRTQREIWISHCPDRHTCERVAASLVSILMSTPAAFMFCWMTCQYSFPMASAELSSAVSESFSPPFSRMPSAPAFQPASSKSFFAAVGSYGYFLTFGL